LVTHRSIEQDGGPAARWRAFARYLPEHGWEVDVLSAAEHAGASEFSTGDSHAVALRAAAMSRVGQLSAPLFARAGVRPDALPLSMLWIPRGALLVRRRVAIQRPDLVLATGPPLAGPLAARLGLPADVPLIVELRDLWAGSPAFDTGGTLLSSVEEWLLRRARRVVACTPEAVSDLRSRHPEIAARVVEVSNGFDPTIVSTVGSSTGRDVPTSRESPANRVGRESPANRGIPNQPDGGRVLTLLHSGTLTPARPLAPLLGALADPRVAGCFRLVLHGYLSPATRAELESARLDGGVEIQVLAPSPWGEALARIAAADGCLITQGRAAGDETAIASKVYEYLALGKPVLCVTDGGATEALLRRLHADELCARLDERETIVQALVRLRDGTFEPPSPERLAPYSRGALAARMAALLDEVACASSTSTIRSPARPSHSGGT
jgi:hypothetical protein